MAIDNFDLQSWMREQKQGPFNKKALKESIGGFVNLNSFTSLNEMDSEEDEDDMEDDWNKPEKDTTPDDDAIHMAAMKQAKKASKSVKGLNPDKDIHDLLYGDDDNDDLYEAMSNDALERMNGLADQSIVRAIYANIEALSDDLHSDGFDEEDIQSYIAQLVKQITAGFGLSNLETDDMEDTVSNDAAYSDAFGSMEDDNLEEGVSREDATNLIEKIRDSGISDTQIVDALFNNILSSSMANTLASDLAQEYDIDADEEGYDEEF